MTNPSDGSSNNRCFGLLWGLAVGVAVAAALVGIWWPPYTPGQDTPHHLFFARVVSEPALFAADYRVIWAPNSQAFVYLSALLAPISGLVVAGKLVRTLGLALLLLAYWLLGRASRESHPPGALFGAAVSASFFHAMGFENFALTLPLGLLAVGMTLAAAREGEWWRWSLVCALLLLSALGHAVLAGMVGFQLVIVTLLAAPGRLRWRRVGALLVSSIPAALHASWCLWLSYRSQRQVGTVEGLGTQRLSFVEQLENLAQASFGGFCEHGWLLLVAALALALTQWLGREAELSPYQRQARQIIGLTILFWGAVYLLTPFHFVGWAYAQPRLLALLVFVPLGFLGWGRWRYAMLFSTSAVALAFLICSALEQRAAGVAVSEQVARFGEGPLGRTMSVRLDPGTVPTSRHVGAILGVDLYALVEGGAMPHLLAENPSIHAVLSLHPPSDWPPHPPLFIHRSIDCTFNPDCVRAALVLAERIAVQGLHFDTVLLVGGPQEYRDFLEARGYARVAPDRFEPRPAELLITFDGVDWPEDYGLLVRAGYPAGFGWFTAAYLPPGQASGPQRLSLTPLPAGRLTIECRWLASSEELERADQAPLGYGREVVLAAERQYELSLSLEPPPVGE